MKRFRCGDIVPGCTTVFEKPNEEQVLAAVAGHAIQDHGMAEIPQSLVAQVRVLIHDVSSAA